MRSIWFLSLFLVLWPNTSMATRLVMDDDGGSISQYMETIGKTKEKVVIIGKCLSACTLWLTLPKDQVCVGPSADFGFHSVYTVVNFQKVYSQKLTDDLIALYPDWIKDWIKEQGGLKPNMKIMNSKYMKKFVSAC